MNQAPKNIVIMNFKGGVGKTFIAMELLASFRERSDPPVPAAFLDLDSQGSAYVGTDRREDAAVAVIDTPGALQPQTADWMRSADVIIIPTRMSSYDMGPLVRMADIARENAGRAPVLYVLNGWTRYRVSRDFEEWFRGRFPDALYEVIPYSEMVMQAAANRKSVVSYAPHSPAARAVRQLCGRVRELAGLPEEAGDTAGS